jgi:hypothetical protein
MPITAKIKPAISGAGLDVTKLITENKITTAQIDSIISVQSPVVI